MTKTLRIIFIIISALLLNIPLVAQEALDSLPADSTAVDSLIADTIEQEPELPWEQRLTRSIDKILEDKLLQTSEVGVMVWDLTADSCLYRYQERQRMRPASTMKTITAIAALDLLGSNYSLKTELRYTGEIREFEDKDTTLQESADCIGTTPITRRSLHGDIYIIGGMDPLFSDKDMDAFISAIASLHLDSIVGTIYSDRSFKDEKRYGHGWCWDDDNPMLSPLLFNRKDHLDDELRYKLRHSGIFLDTSNGNAIAPTNSTLLCQREHRLTEVLKPMMKKSDNLFAECVFYQIAHHHGGKKASANDACKAVERLIRKVGLDIDDYTIADGSGLSLYDYVSAELETMLLRYAYMHKPVYDALLPTLPIAGVDGTLSDRMRATKAHRNVQAKTGTVAGVSSLAGYCTAANGHHLCFSIINQGVKGHKQPRAFQDRLCTLLCR